MAELKVTYADVEISYVEDTNRWQFTLRGRERSAESLAKAKEAIDKPEPQKSAPFQRIKVWTAGGYGGNWRRGEVTSIAETTRRYGSREVWISVDGKREKVDADKCYPDTPKTIAAIEAIRANEAEMSRLRDESTKLRAAMKPIELPKED